MSEQVAGWGDYNIPINLHEAHQRLEGLFDGAQGLCIHRAIDPETNRGYLYVTATMDNGVHVVGGTRCELGIAKGETVEGEPVYVIERFFPYQDERRELVVFYPDSDVSESKFFVRDDSRSWRRDDPSFSGEQYLCSVVGDITSLTPDQCDDRLKIHQKPALTLGCFRV